jgi:hypothetical protein
MVSKEFSSFNNYDNYIKSLPRKGDEVQIDRIDNDGHYERGNLRWSTISNNCINRSTTIFVLFKGEEMCLSQFTERHTRVSFGCVKSNMGKGMSLEEITNLKPKTIVFCGLEMTFKSFVKNYCKISLRTAHRLKSKNLSLEEIAKHEIRRKKCV